MLSSSVLPANNTSISQDPTNAKILIPKSKWVADEKAASCFNCNADFIFLIKRRHHCRMCGQVFCSKCSCYFLEPSSLGITHDEKSIRFCEYCYKIVAKIIGLNSKSDIKEISPNFGDESQDLVGLSQNIFLSYPENKNDHIDISGDYFQVVYEKIEKITEFLFKRYDLYDKYFKLLVDKLKRASTEIIINTLVYEDPMNINEYVKIKKILYPDQSECKYICGVVCSKNISHRKMKGSLNNPKILIISPSLEIPHCKRESLTYFEDLKENEDKFIKQSISNIVKISPNIILVEKSISGKIQNSLYNREIIYVQKIKSKLLKRISRATQGQIFEDIIKVNKAKIDINLGHCKGFYVRTFYESGSPKTNIKGKDLMYFDGCKEGYGATITVSGPDMAELTILKKCMKQILIVARHLYLEKELVALERKFEIYKNIPKNSPEINTQGDFRNFVDEKIPLKELIDYTKISCMKLNLVEVSADFFHDLASLNEKFIGNILISIQNNKFRFKVPYLAVMCGNPLQKCHEFYSDDGGGEENPQDTTLGNYIKLRVNNLFTRCNSCKRPRYRHVIVYYYRNTYLKVTAELIGVAKALAYRREEDSLRQGNSFILDRTPKAYSSEIDWKNTENSKLLQNPMDEKLLSFGNNSNKLEFKSPLHKISSTTPKSSNILPDSPFNNFGTKIASMFSKQSKNTPSGSDNNLQVSEPSETRPKSSTRDINKRTIIQTYIECQNCNERLTNIHDLQILYLEYSFSEFLRHFFINNFPKDIDWTEYEKTFEKNECQHLRKSRVFKYDEFLVKFDGGPNKIYSIKKVDFVDEAIQNELKAKDEAIFIEKSQALTEKVNLLMRLLKEKIIEKKNLIRKPRLRSSIMNTQSFNPDSLTSPLKKKELISLIKDLNDIQKSFEIFNTEYKAKLAKASHYLDIEKIRINCFFFFMGVLQKLNIIDEQIPKDFKGEESDRFTLRNIKKMFTFRTESFSPMFNSTESNNKPLKKVISGHIPLANADSDENVANKAENTRKNTLIKNNSIASKFHRNEFLSTSRIPIELTIRHQKSKSCPTILNEFHKFPLFLSEDEIKIPTKMLISLKREESFTNEKKNGSNQKVKSLLRYDSTCKSQSEDPPKLETKKSMKLSILNDSGKKKVAGLHIPLENDQEENFINTPQLGNNEKKESIYENASEKEDNTNNNSKEKIENDSNNDETKSDSDMYKNFNPNNLLKPPKHLRKRSSTSFLFETAEWQILMDLMKGLCENEHLNENELKANQCYRFIPVIKSQHLSVIANALNSMKYLKEIYAKEGFYEQQKFLKGHCEPSVKQEHLTNFIRMKLYRNETVEKNDEFVFQTNILEIKKAKFFYRNSFHNLEKLLQEEENRIKIRKNTVPINSFDQNEDIMSYLGPANKVKILIYYPTQFEALRMSQNISQTDFIKSLAMSNIWADNTGGKSNASFIKSYNNLFVFKNLKNNEFRMFKSYAIKFFKYMFKVCFERKKRSFLAKIYGLFEIHIDSDKYYYVAMENLQSGLDLTQNLKTYDLKGSETNRYVPNNKSNQVLHDTNFKIDQNGEPLSLKYEDKQYLSEAFENDTKFLSKHNLIDYSLLMIIDRKNSLIRIGIIDYLRLFTWDKQVESFGKKMIKAGATPTIINAVDYRKRFLEAMNKYFMGIHQ